MPRPNPGPVLFQPVPAGTGMAQYLTLVRPVTRPYLVLQAKNILGVVVYGTFEAVSSLRKAVRDLNLLYTPTTPFQWVVRYAPTVLGGWGYFQYPGSATPE